MWQLCSILKIKASQLLYEMHDLQNTIAKHLQSFLRTMNFIASSTRRIGAESASTVTHSCPLKGTVPKTLVSGGMYKIDT
mmetsp:Transcript_3500/g.12450  ORF Transcript_3500/g.12450 Transcript_3500/m.12450 type:complete len:80 (+) Transcript_3500:87-326(+)